MADKTHENASLSPTRNFLESYCKLVICIL